MADTRRARRLQNRRQRTLSGSSSAKSSRTGVLLGVAGALIAALLVYQVFMKSDDASVATGTPAPAAAVAPEGATTTTVPLEPELPNGSFDELSLRDPFEPVGSVSDGGDSSDTVPDTTPDTVPDTPSDTIPTTPTTSPAQNPGATTEVALLDITDVNGVTTARVRVGTAEYSVVAGGVFGPTSNYRLVAFVSPTCADFIYADSQFRLCVGEQVIK